MTNKDTSDQQPTAAPNEGGLSLDVDPGAVDLGADVYRAAQNTGGQADPNSPSTLDGSFDPGTTDLGDDVNRDAANRDAQAAPNYTPDATDQIEFGTQD